MQSTGQAWSWSLVSDLFCFFIATNGQRCHYCNSCIKWDLEAIFLKEDDKFHGFSVSWKPSDIMQKWCIFSHHSRWNHTTKYKILRPLTTKEVKYKTKNHNGSEHWAHEACQWTEFQSPDSFIISCCTHGTLQTTEVPAERKEQTAIVGSLTSTKDEGRKNDGTKRPSGMICLLIRFVTSHKCFDSMS